MNVYNEVEALCERIRALATPPAGQVAAGVQGAVACWHEGPPPFPQNQEWFIAETIYGDRVVLRALEDGLSYDYTTADRTFMKVQNVKRWMQFPDCAYLPPSKPAPAAAAVAGEPVAWCALTPSGKIAHFDGKPMVMPGPVGNECHPVALVVRQSAPATAGKE